MTTVSYIQKEKLTISGHFQLTKLFPCHLPGAPGMNFGYSKLPFVYIALMVSTVACGMKQQKLNINSSVAGLHVNVTTKN